MRKLQNSAKKSVKNLNGFRKGHYVQTTAAQIAGVIARLTQPAAHFRQDDIMSHLSYLCKVRAQLFVITKLSSK
jgi:hypothetical protein